MHLKVHINTLQCLAHSKLSIGFFFFFLVCFVAFCFFYVFTSLYLNVYRQVVSFGMSLLPDESDPFVTNLGN